MGSTPVHPSVGLHSGVIERRARGLPRGAVRGIMRGMSRTALNITRLSRDEQFELLDELWGALGRDPEAFPLSEEQKAELDGRLDELDAEGPVGLHWDDVVAMARAGRR